MIIKTTSSISIPILGIATDVKSPIKLLVTFNYKANLVKSYKSFKEVARFVVNQTQGCITDSSSSDDQTAAGENQPIIESW